MRDFLLVILMCLVQGMITSLKINELRVPAQVADGSEAMLGCDFDVENEMLYGVKWYKDGREFYRYMPGSKPPSRAFSPPGIQVDLSRSFSDVVTLTNLTQSSAGVYSCEVSGEAPSFSTVMAQKQINVHLLPTSPPTITKLADTYKIGEKAFLNCTSSSSKPEAKLVWFINDLAAPRKHLQGPWYRVSEERPDAIITILQLRFMLKPKHFKNGLLSLKCRATIAPLYQEESEEILSEPGKHLESSSEDDLFDPSEYDDSTKTFLQFSSDDAVRTRLNCLMLAIVMLSIIYIV